MDSFKILTSGAKFRTDSRKSKPESKPPEISKVQDVIQTNQKRRKFDPDQFRQENGIIVDGTDVPPPIRSFQDVPMPDYLRENLEKSDYQTPTPIQMQTVPLMLDRRELIACAPTGSGKTLAFLLPIIIQLEQKKSQQGFRAIILAPTRELAKQIHREALWIANGSGLRIHLIKNINLAQKKFNAESKLKYDILITTPKRLEYLLRSEPPAINVKNLEWMVVDECDRLFQTSFVDQLAAICNVCWRESEYRTKMAMFSATYDRDLHQWCSDNLTNIVTVVVGQRNMVAEAIDQQLIFTGTEAGKLFALRKLVTGGCRPPVLIFVNTIRKANYLQREVESMLSGLPEGSVDAIHADRDQRHRDQIVRRFREGSILFLICTELMGRGVDFRAVNLVINYDLPSSVVAYIHHVGRTGRAGRPGRAVTFYGGHDEWRICPILNVMLQSGCQLPEHLAKYLDKTKLQALLQQRVKPGNQKKKKQQRIHRGRKRIGGADAQE